MLQESYANNRRIQTFINVKGQVKFYQSTFKRSIDEIMKLIEVSSKRTLYKYLAYRRRRNCVICNKILLDKEQPIDDAHCEKHRKAKFP